MSRGRVLVACEFSGRVRDAFTAVGWEAWSADLRPSLTPGKHYQGDVRDVLYEEWDLLIAHPPCTYLANSGVSWLNRQEGRRDRMREGAEFFLEMLNAPVARIAVENPKMHGEALALCGRPSQWIEPHEYGVMETKKTGLWLRNLPPLIAWGEGWAYVKTLHRRDRRPGEWAGGKAEDRHGVRSITSPGIALAMAEQWGSCLDGRAVAGARSA
jgi:hypothetical protein